MRFAPPCVELRSFTAKTLQTVENDREKDWSDMDKALRDQTHRERMYRPFQFHKRS
jgi:hypothetical protein